MGESNATIQLHAWFGRQIFQPGTRVVVCRTCSTFSNSPAAEKIPIVAVCEVVMHYGGNPNRPCEHGGNRMDVLGPFFSRHEDGTIKKDDLGRPIDDSPWLVCTCECVLYDPTT